MAAAAGSASSTVFAAGLCRAYVIWTAGLAATGLRGGCMAAGDDTVAVEVGSAIGSGSRLGVIAATAFAWTGFAFTVSVRAGAIGTGPAR